MKNRYLLLITLISGLTTKVVQASDGFKELASLPIAYKAVENALPKDHTIAKTAAAVYAPPARLTQDEQRRKDTYQTARNYLTQYNIKSEYANWYLKTAENLMLGEGEKYDPDFGSRFKAWCVNTQWGISAAKTYFMASHFIRNIIKDGPKFNSADRASFHHERGHDYFDHGILILDFITKMTKKENFFSFYRAKNKEEFLQIPNRKDLLEDLISFHYFCIENEKEADAFIPDDPTLLAAEVKFFTFRAHNSIEFYPEHPSDEQRAEYFRGRFKIALQLQNKETLNNLDLILDDLIEDYANDFYMKIEYHDNYDHTTKQSNFLDFSDEYSVYLALKPAVLRNVSVP